MSGDIFDRVERSAAAPQQDAVPVGGDIFDRVDGRVAAQSDFGVDFSQSKAVVRRAIKALPKGQQKAAMRKWADTFVAKERKAGKGSIGQNVNDVVRNLTTGTVVGSWLNEANAATSAALGGDYDEAIAYQNATDRAISKDSTTRFTLPYIGEVKDSGLQKLAGGVLSAPITPVVRAWQAAGAAPRIFNGLVSGALYGGVYGAGEDGGQGRAVNAGIGFGAGVVGGAAIPAAAAGGSRAINYLSSRAPLPNQLRQFDRRAVTGVSDAVRQDGITPRRLTHAGVPNDHGTVTALGSQGMIADLGQNTSSLAGGIMKRQGTGAGIASQAIRARRRGAQGRIDDATTATLGRPLNTVQTQRQALEATRAAADPHYRAFYDGPVVTVTPELGRALQGAATTPAFQQTLNSMRRRNLPVNFETGTNVNQFLDRLRRNVSSLANKTAGSNINPGDRSLASEYTAIARTINREIDNALSPGNPAAGPYAQARAIAGEGLQYESGLKAGERSIAKNVSPNQVRADMDQMPPAEQLGLREGQRRGLRDLMETTTTRFGRAPTAGIRQMIGPQARQKIALAAPAGRAATGMRRTSPVVFEDYHPFPNNQPGPRLEAPTMAPGQLARTVDQEAWFNRLYEKGVQNSQANANANAQRVLPSQPGDLSGPTYRNATYLGMGMETGTRLLNALRNTSINESNDRIVADMARMLVAQGGDRQAIAQGLVQFARNQNLTGQHLQRLEGVVEIVMRGGQPATVNSLVGP